jgi:integrase
VRISPSLISFSPVYRFGFRKGELLVLKVEQVDLRAGTIRLLPGLTKNRKGRVVSMTQDVFTILAACVAGKDGKDFVVTRAMGRRFWTSASDGQS